MAEITRTRTFEPDDVNYQSSEQIEERLRQLKEKMDSFDPETQSTGLHRLESSNSFAEVIAFCQQPKSAHNFNWYAWFAAGATTGLLFGIIQWKIRSAYFITGVARGLALAPVGGLATAKLYDFNRNKQIRKQKIYLQYALMHEHELPRYGSFFFTINH